FTRAERLDGVFFLDLPSTAERDTIWQMYRKQFGIPEGFSQGWDRRSGGEQQPASLAPVPTPHVGHHSAAPRDPSYRRISCFRWTCRPTRKGSTSEFFRQ